MTDLNAMGRPVGEDWTSDAAMRRIRRRYGAERRLKLFGLGAIGLALGLEHRDLIDLTIGHA